MSALTIKPARLSHLWVKGSLLRSRFFGMSRNVAPLPKKRLRRRLCRLRALAEYCDPLAFFFLFPAVGERLAQFIWFGRSRTGSNIQTGPEARFSKDPVFDLKVSRKVGRALTSDEVHFVSLADNFTVQFSNRLKLPLEWKTKQLYEPGNYQEPTEDPTNYPRIENRNKRKRKEAWPEGHITY